MLSLRNRFGIPGVISVIALVFAMLGGAYAASNSSGGGKATASAKTKRGPKGPKGATGPAGPAGAQGPAGANGKDGANGSNGSAGLQGSQGLPGKSVAVANYSGPECEGSEEGATVEVAGEPATKKYVCDGVPGAGGAQGPQGSPWTAGGTLPPSSAAGCPCTETGVWLLVKAGIAMRANISFTIPLAASLDDAHVHYINIAGKEVRLNEEEVPVESTSTACLGTVADPKATSGNLCVYAKTNSAEHTLWAYSEAIFDPAQGAFQSFEGGSAGKSGAIITVPGEGNSGFGTWAVTG
jgi:hypothetical protein